MVNIPSPAELAQIRLDNALALFEEFVRLTARQADAAALRGLERRFAEQVDIQPSYWSQIKSRSRQIGERLARQFEQRCQKPAGWMDRRHDASAPPQAEPADTPGPRDDDERFIVGLVLTYYRRHPQRARTRLLDLLGEVLTPAPDAAPAPVRRSGPVPGSSVPPLAPPPARRAGEPDDLWLRTRAAVAPLRRKR